MNDDATIEYIQKANDCTCYIINENNNSTGWFVCKIPYTKKKNLFLNVLIACEHVLTEDIVFSNKKIKLKVNDKEKIISLEKERKRWSNKEMDYSCIEILEEANILKYYQLDDDVLNNKVNNDIYLYKNIIIFAIINKKMGHCDGLINKIDKSLFIHDCNTYPGSSGGVIVNKNNNLVIGMHIGDYKVRIQ